MDNEMIIVIAAGAGCVLVILLITALYCCCKKKCSKNSDSQQANATHGPTSAGNVGTGFSALHQVTIDIDVTENRNIPTGSWGQRKAPSSLSASHTSWKPLTLNHQDSRSLPSPECYSNDPFTRDSRTGGDSIPSRRSYTNSITRPAIPDAKPNQFVVSIPLQDVSNNNYTNNNDGIYTISGGNACLDHLDQFDHFDQHDSSTPPAAPRTETYDLHGMSVDDAMDLVEDVLEYASPGNTFKIITGRGLHSIDGIPKIKPAVEDYLDENGLNYKWKNKGGMVVVRT